MDYSKVYSLKALLERTTDNFYNQGIININTVVGDEAKRLDKFLKERNAEFYFDYFIEWMIYFFQDNITYNDAEFRNELRKRNPFMDRDDLITIKIHRVGFETINSLISDITVRIRAMNEFDKSKSMAKEFLFALESIYQVYISLCNRNRINTVENFLNNLKTLTT